MALAASIGLPIPCRVTIPQSLRRKQSLPRTSEFVSGLRDRDEDHSAPQGSQDATE